MPVFDFNHTPEKGTAPECTYTTFLSGEPEATAEKPILILDNQKKQWPHHSCGVFTNPVHRTSFEFKEERGVVSADIRKIDARFVSLIKWLGENRINVRLSGENRPEGYCVYRIREIAFGGGTKLSAEDGFLQFMIERLFASSAPAETASDEEEAEDGDEMKLTSIQSITDFMTCAGRTLPDNIRLWARRNLAVARSAEVSQEERRHAQRALSIMMNIQWKNNYNHKLKETVTLLTLFLPSSEGDLTDSVNHHSSFRTVFSGKAYDDRFSPGHFDKAYKPQASIFRICADNASLFFKFKRVHIDRISKYSTQE